MHERHKEIEHSQDESKAIRKDAHVHSLQYALSEFIG